MNSKQLQYALMIYENLSFSSVAEKLGITQPALSKQIHNLENEIGVKLFDRTTSPVTVTSAGEYFFAKAKKLLYSQNQLLQSMQDFKSGKRGCLTIGISPFRSMYLIPNIIKQFKEKYPDIKVVLHETSSDVLRKEASEGKYDLAIVNLPVDESVLDVTPIESDQLVLAVPNNFCDGLIKDEQIDLANCKHLPFVVVSQTQEMRHLFDKSCAAVDFEPKIVMEVVGISTAWAMCRAGIGATLLPRQFAEYMGLGNNINLYSLKHSLHSRQPVIVTRKGQYISEFAKYVIELLTQ